MSDAIFLSNVVVQSMGAVCISWLSHISSCGLRVVISAKSMCDGGYCVF